MSANIGESENETCRVCGETSTVVTWEREPFKYLQCKGCYTYRVFPAPADEDLKSLYSGEEYYHSPDNTDFGYQDYDQQREPLIKTAKHRIRRYQKWTAAKPEKLLEIGCSVGHYAQALRAQYDNPPDYLGIDMNTYAVNATCNAGFKAMTGTIEDCKGDEEFDLIAFFDLFEHIPEPTEFLTQCRRLLRQRGSVFFATPSTSSFVRKISGNNWVSFIPKEHLYLYNPESLRQLLQKCGFTMRYCKTDYQWVDMSFLVSKVSEAFPALKLPSPKFGSQRLLPVPNGNMLVYAEKQV